MQEKIPHLAGAVVFNSEQTCKERWGVGGETLALTAEWPHSHLGAGAAKIMPTFQAKEKRKQN